MESYYEFTNETKNINGHTLHRIRCIKKVHNNVNPGDLGGWIEKPENLRNNAWVFGNAKVYDNAQVFGNAQVSGDAEVFGNAWVSGDAEVYGDAKVSGDAWVCSKARVFGNVLVCSKARVFGNVLVSGNAQVRGDAWVSGNAQVRGDAWVSGNAQVRGDADYCCFQSFGSSGRTTTVFREKDGGIKVSCGCFFGTLDEFAERVEKQHGDNQFGKEYQLIIEMIKLRFPILTSGK